ncbi:MAG TPA: hypothetical protein VEG08_11725 [Terriglobales bacterium]|nr:hypothetical protein [Terriglobales bacterium]
MPLEKMRASYAIFYVKDDQTGALDDNSGQYWDLVFCDPSGQKSSGGAWFQAESYAGKSWPLHIQRKKDLDRSIAILETALASGQHRSWLLSTLWEYKAERGGGGPQAYAAVAKEVEQVLAAHADDRDTRAAVTSFVLQYEQRLPADFVKRAVATLDAKVNASTPSLRGLMAFNHAQMEPDPKKRLAALDAVLATYPNAVPEEIVQQQRLDTLVELSDLPGAEAAFAKFQQAADRNKDSAAPGRYNASLELARLYVQKGVKLDAALKLIDEAWKSLASEETSGKLIVPPDVRLRLEGECAGLRARAYLGLHQTQRALGEAQMAVERAPDRAEAHFVLAQAYAAAADKRSALDHYFDAALLPSNRDLEYRAELERFYRKNFGGRTQYESELKTRISRRFQAADYVPKLLDRPAPALEFTTLKGEKFDAGALQGRTVVINFWSPG